MGLCAVIKSEMFVRHSRVPTGNEMWLAQEKRGLSLFESRGDSGGGGGGGGGGRGALEAEEGLRDPSCNK